MDLNETKGEGFYPPSANALNAGRMLLFPDVDGGGSVATADADVIAEAKASVFGDDAKPDDGAAAQTQQPPAKPATLSGAPAGGAQAQPGAAAKAPAGWESAPLPEGHPMAAKYRTMGEFVKAYQESSSEGKRLAEQTGQYRRFFQALHQKGLLDRNGRVVAGGAQALPGGAPAGQPQAAGSKGYYGFPSLEEWGAHYEAARKADPLRAVTDSVLARVKHDPAYAKELQGLFAPAIEERVAPLALQHEVGTVQSVGARFFAEHPEASDPNHPTCQAMERFMLERGWLAPAEDGTPGLVLAARALKETGLSPFEVAHSYVISRLAPAQAKAAEARVIEQRKTAETARGSGAGKTVPKNATEAEIARNIAADTGISDPAVIEAMEDMLKGGR